MTVHGEHKSLELAERHRRRLERETGKRWKISSRKNAKGKASARGRFFTFRSAEKQQWAIKVSYSNSEKPFHGELRFESERQLTDDQATEIAEKILKGEKVKKITVKVFTYGRNSQANPQRIRSGEFSFTAGFDFEVS